MLSKLNLDPKCQGHSRNQKLMTWGRKNMPPKKNLSRSSLSNWCDAEADADADRYVDPTLQGVDITRMSQRGWESDKLIQQLNAIGLSGIRGVTHRVLSRFPRRTAFPKTREAPTKNPKNNLQVGKIINILIFDKVGNIRSRGTHNCLFSRTFYNFHQKLLSHGVNFHCEIRW